MGCASVQQGTHKERENEKCLEDYCGHRLCGLLVGGGAVQLLHAQSKPPAFVVAEVAVKDKGRLRRELPQAHHER